MNEKDLKLTVICPSCSFIYKDISIIPETKTGLIRCQSCGKEFCIEKVEKNISNNIVIKTSKNI